MTNYKLKKNLRDAKKFAGMRYKRTKPGDLIKVTKLTPPTKLDVEGII